MRREYEMTDKDHEALLNASKPVPYMIIGGYIPRTPQANANAAWQSLGRRMGFEWDTVRPVSGKGPRFFTAEEAVSDASEAIKDEEQTAEAFDNGQFGVGA